MSRTLSPISFSLAASLTTLAGCTAPVPDRAGESEVAAGKTDSAGTDQAPDGRARRTYFQMAELNGNDCRIGGLRDARPERVANPVTEDEAARLEEACQHLVERAVESNLVAFDVTDITVDGWIHAPEARYQEALYRIDVVESDRFFRGETAAGEPLSFEYECEKPEGCDVSIRTRLTGPAIWHDDPSILVGQRLEGTPPGVEELHFFGLPDGHASFRNVAPGTHVFTVQIANFEDVLPYWDRTDIEVSVNRQWRFPQPQRHWVYADAAESVPPDGRDPVNLGNCRFHASTLGDAEPPERGELIPHDEFIDERREVGSVRQLLDTQCGPVVRAAVPEHRRLLSIQYRGWLSDGHDHYFAAYEVRTTADLAEPAPHTTAAP